MNLHLYPTLLDRRTVRTVALCAVVWLMGSAQAQTLQPGLWEFKHHVQMAGGDNAMAQRMAQMQEQLKNMPPESRKMMQEQLASQGISMNMGAGGEPVVLRVCIGPEEAKADPVREGHSEQGCTYTKVSRQGNTWKGRVVCQEPPSQGEFTTTLHSATHFSTQARVTSQEHGPVQMSTQARRIADDCAALSKKKGG